MYSLIIFDVPSTVAINAVEVCGCTLNNFSLFSPEDQATLESVVEDYFICINEDECESFIRDRRYFEILLFVCKGLQTYIYWPILE